MTRTQLLAASLGGGTIVVLWGNAPLPVWLCVAGANISSVAWAWFVARRIK
ncbi:hypothetical protein Lepto7375DRAFT_0618 [Leptolyngbya sp. PCC 7375]|nr:hypothetical protein Lepto7375DRAFT_0618 [Leptolyngbya sp. PCC 7375]